LGKEGTVIRMTILPFVYYALLPGSIGYFIVFYADKGLLNAGTVLVAAIIAFAVYFVSSQLHQGSSS